ncbi:probable protein phosphatase 2C 27 [Rutidosis leptorrhynchoides]|uniref:probable protein phosphatase 2C 27 n=1 Tax=Rutidosis leptorrhynchoides TaxID=125765 RepID=UPI003A98F0CB
MAAGTGFSQSYVMVDDSFNNDITSDREEKSQNSDQLSQLDVGKPPRHLPVVRHSISTATLLTPTDPDFDLGIVSIKSTSGGKSEYTPMIRSGSCAEKGPKEYMEDEHICIDDLLQHLDRTDGFPSLGAFYGVFDGHGGTDAACYVRKNILKFIVEDPHFPGCLKKAIRNAYIKADQAFAENSSVDVSSGTTALTTFIFGRMMVVANAGDCRAVLGKRGRALELSNDHKPNSISERHRIEQLGGVIYDGYLNGQLSVSRALGDWHMKGPKGSACSLSAEPELQEILLMEDDEFLIMGCDGLWDVMSSQCAVTIARKELMIHNDPERCSRELVREALKRSTCDNLTVIVICFSPDPPPWIEVQSQMGGHRRSISSEGLNFLKGVLDGNM